jgi:hypothetical protein
LRRELGHRSRGQQRLVIGMGVKEDDRVRHRARIAWRPTTPSLATSMSQSPTRG